MRFLLLSLCLVVVITADAQHISIDPPQIINQVNCTGMAVSPDASYFITNKRYGAGVQVWERSGVSFKPGQVLGDYGMSSNFPQRYAITNNGNRFIVANTDFTQYVFDRHPDGTFTKAQTFTIVEDMTMFLAFSPDDKLLIAGNNDVMKVYKNDVELKEIGTVTKPGAVTFIPGSNLVIINEILYTYSSAGTLTQVQDLESLEDASGVDISFAECVAASHNGKYVVAMHHYKVALYERKGNTLSFLSNVEVPNDLNTLSFSPDDQYVTAGEDDMVTSKIYLFQIQDGKLTELNKYAPLKDDIEAAYFTNDGKFLLAGSDGDLAIYPVKGLTGKVTVVPRKTVARADTPPAPNVNPAPTPTPTPVPAPVPAPGGTTINIYWLSPNPDVLDDKPVVTDQPSIQIQVKVVSDKPLTKEDINVIINGKPESRAKFNEVVLKQNTTRSDAPQQKEYTFVKTVALQGGRNELEIIAGGKKSPQKVSVLYNAGRPSLHILAIGTTLDLQFPKKDAQDFASLFSKQGGKDRLFASVDIKTLIGHDATTNAIKEAIEYYKYQFNNGSISSNDVILVYISSHGFMYQNKFRIQGDDYKELYKETYSVAYDEIVSRLNEVDCKKMIFLDACFSGGAKASPSDINAAIVDINRQHTGTVTFSSCSNDEYSYEDVTWNNGAFTKAIVDALSGKKSDKDGNGIITVNELYEYVRTAVPSMVETVKHKGQHPTMPVTDLLMDTPVYITD